MKSLLALLLFIPSLSWARQSSYLGEYGGGGGIIGTILGLGVFIFIIIAVFSEGNGSSVPAKSKTSNKQKKFIEYESLVIQLKEIQSILKSLKRRGKERRDFWFTDSQVGDTYTQNLLIDKISCFGNEKDIYFKDIYWIDELIKDFKKIDIEDIEIIPSKKSYFIDIVGTQLLVTDEEHQITLEQIEDNEL